MQAVAAASLAAGGTPPSTECPPVDLADPAASPSAPACAREDQNSNVVVVGGEMHDATMNHNHVHHQQQQQDCAESSFDESAAAVTAPSTLTLRLIMQGKVTCRCLCCACRGCAISADNLCLPLQDDPASRPHGRMLGA